MTETKQTRDELIDTATNAILAAIALDWLTLPEVIEPALATAAVSGVTQGSTQLETSAGLNEASEAARQYAADRSVELIGMQRDAEGNLTPDEDAEWCISTTSREKLRAIVANAFRENATVEDIQASTQAALQKESETGIFSDGRAHLVARNELAVAQSHGHYGAWVKSGVIKRVRWVVLSDNPCGECESLDGVEFELADIADEFPPRHPHCMCQLEISDIEAA